MIEQAQLLACQIVQINPITDKVIQVLMRPLEGKRLNYLAGQYIEIVTPNGEQTPFSIANAPLGGQQLELHIRHTPENIFSHYLLNEIKKSGQIMINGPFGHCNYHQHPKLTTLLLAGGTGFAPIKAIIEQALAQGEVGNMHLYWGARSASDLYLDALPRYWEKTIANFRYTPVLSERALTGNWQGKVCLPYEAIAKDYPNLSCHQLYAAGPPDLVSSAWRVLQPLGLKKEHTYSDTL